MSHRSHKNNLGKMRRKAKAKKDDKYRKAVRELLHNSRCTCKECLRKRDWSNL